MTVDTPPPLRSPDTRYVLGAVPLRRPLITRFLRDWHVPARGAQVSVVEQRPTARARATWLRRLAALDGDQAAAVTAALSIDDPMVHIGQHRTDRLLPREHLDDDTYLERNLGGWAALWLGCIGLTDPRPADPLLDHLEVVVDYGQRITAITAPPALVAERLAVEFAGDDAIAVIARGAAAVLDLREWADDVDRAVALAAAIRGDGALADEIHPLQAHDALLELLYRLELGRRSAVADDHAQAARALSGIQARLTDDLGVSLMLKGEYVLGRSRRSTVMLAEGLGVVVKEPACEAEHDIELGARTVAGKQENWPVADEGGRVVTPRARMAQVVSEHAVTRLNAAFGRDVMFSTVLGLSVEPWAQGPTLAALATDDPAELTQQRYDEVLVHQLACEALEVDNPDWHAANFVVSDDGLTHVDWGAARVLDDDEKNPRATRERLDQVVQLAYSFQDSDLAERTHALHRRATTDDEHLETLRARARAIVD